jgi:hypothetical protein
LRLLLEDRFPRIWVPSWDNRLRQLLWHRHRMVQARTRIMNQLQAVALNEGLRFKKRLWREAGRQQLESFPWLLGPTADGIPCDENHPGVDGCDYSMVEASDAVSSRTAAHEGPSHFPAALRQTYKRFSFPRPVIAPND